jgi:hypothetical protein
MLPSTAVLILHARLLGATYRRVAELFGDRTGHQLDGERLVSEAERVLGLEPGWVDDEGTEREADEIHEQLGIEK